MKNNILITGASGYIGRQFLEACAAQSFFNTIVATDLRPPKEELPGVIYHQSDIRSKEVTDLIEQHDITIVAHLAAVISITGSMPRHVEYDIDVNGSMRLIEASIQHGVKRFITTSSGAAYGYWPSNTRMRLTEDMPMRGNDEIPYSFHKWLIEERLKKERKEHPEMEQYIFRVGTVIGKDTNNPITDYFLQKKPVVLKGYDSSFVMIWDKDLVNILHLAATGEGKPGVYNVAGNDPVNPRELIRHMGKEPKEVRAGLARIGLSLLHPLRLAPYPPQQLKFIQYRPVLDNTKLKTTFAYQPKKTTMEAFLTWWNNQDK